MADEYTPTTENMRELVGNGCKEAFTDARVVGEALFDRWLAAHDAEVWSTGDAVIRAVLDALGVGYDHDPVLAAREAKSVSDKFGEWLDSHDAEVARAAVKKALRDLAVERLNKAEGGEG